MTRVDYRLYLASEAWKARRSFMLCWAEHRCQLCASPDKLQVHHRTYDRLGNERPADLVVLCDGCHAKFHDKQPAIPAAELLPAPALVEYLPGWGDIELTPAALVAEPDDEVEDIAFPTASESRYQPMPSFSWQHIYDRRVQAA